MNGDQNKKKAAFFQVLLIMFIFEWYKLKLWPYYDLKIKEKRLKDINMAFQQHFIYNSMFTYTTQQEM